MVSALLVLLSLSFCKRRSEGQVGGGEPQVISSSEAVIGKGGGEIGTEGIKVQIQSESLLHETKVKVRKVSTAPFNYPRYFRPTEIYELLPRGLRLQKPAKVVMEYTDEEREKGIVVLVYHEMEGVVEPVSYEIDEGKKEIIFEIRSFSYVSKMVVEDVGATGELPKEGVYYKPVTAIVEVDPPVAGARVGVGFFGIRKEGIPESSECIFYGIEGDIMSSFPFNLPTAGEVVETEWRGKVYGYEGREYDRWEPQQWFDVGEDGRTIVVFPAVGFTMALCMVVEVGGEIVSPHFKFLLSIKLGEYGAGEIVDMGESYFVKVEPIRLWIPAEVYARNRPPVIYFLGASPKSIDLGGETEISFRVADPDGDSFSISLTTVKEGEGYGGGFIGEMRSDEERGGLIGSIRWMGEREGVWEIVLTARDEGGEESSRGVKVYVGCDKDKDGWLSELCGGTDPDDYDAGVTGGCPAVVWYRDSDGDGYGDPSDTITACERPTGYVDNDLDCDDYDVGITVVVWWKDSDGDGYTDGTTQVSCTSPGVEYVRSATAGDCDDTDPNVNPSAEEIKDGKDNNCNGQVDEAGLVLELKFDECSGDVARDTSGMGNDGTIYGAAWVDLGGGNCALKFDGIDDYVEVPDNDSLDLTRSFTWMVWINWSGSGYDLHDIIFNKEESYEWAIDDGSSSRVKDGNLGWALKTDPPYWYWHDTGISITPNAWVHLTLIYDGYKVYVYENGVLKIVDSNVDGGGGDVVPNNNPLRIGQRDPTYSDGGNFYGLIDNVRIWKRALTEQEIADIYNSEKSSYGQDDSAIYFEAVQVALGNYHTCAVKVDGSLWCWGANGSGQLGVGDTTNRSIPIQVMSEVSQVALGGYHTCAVKTDGTLWCWGMNNSGQLGVGDSTSRYTPVQVMNGVSQVALGWKYTCAMKTDGSLWCWGYNYYGQLGVGDTTNKYTPIQVMDGVKQIDLGWRHTCAVKTDDSLWCWGWNTEGQLGLGDTTDRNVPVSVMNGVKQIDLYGNHSCAIKIDNSLWCWGRNDYGQLGLGDTNDRYAPVQAMNNVTQIALGGEHTCAVKTDSSLWCWGRNYYGQLGLGDTTDRHTPEQVRGMQ